MEDAKKSGPEAAEGGNGVKRYVVRMGALRQIGLMSGKQKDDYHRGQKVLCRTQRGLEIGEVLCKATEHTLSVMENYASGHIQRELTPVDVRDQEVLE